MGDHVERGTGRDSKVETFVGSVDRVTAKIDLRDFLATRRAKLTPQQLALPVYGANRRVTGLRGMPRWISLNPVEPMDISRITSGVHQSPSTSVPVLIGQ